MFNFIECAAVVTFVGSILTFIAGTVITPIGVTSFTMSPIRTSSVAFWTNSHRRQFSFTPLAVQPQSDASK